MWPSALALLWLCRWPQEQGSPRAAAAHLLQARRWGHAGLRPRPTQHLRACQVSLFTGPHLQPSDMSTAAAEPAAGGRYARPRAVLETVHGRDDTATAHGEMNQPCDGMAGCDRASGSTASTTNERPIVKWKPATAVLTVLLGSCATGEAGTMHPRSPPPLSWRGGLIQHRRCCCSPLGPCRG